MVAELKVAVGDTVSEGSLILARCEARGVRRRGRSRGGAGAPSVAEPAAAPAAPAVRGARRAATTHAQVVVLGAGPGGYTAAFRAADLGLRGRPGRALRDARRRVPERRLHPVQGAAARRAGDRRGRGGRRATASASASPRSTSTRCARGRTSVVGQLTGGLAGLAKQRKVEVVTGDGAASPAPNAARGRGHDGRLRALHHRRGLAAPPSCPASRTTTRASSTRPARSSSPEVPERLLVIGGGIIGLEMATVYDALGSEVTVVELLDQLIPGCDPDLVRPLHKRIARPLRGDPPRHAGRARSRRATTGCT